MSERAHEKEQQIKRAKGNRKRRRKITQRQAESEPNAKQRQMHTGKK